MSDLDSISKVWNAFGCRIRDICRTVVHIQVVTIQLAIYSASMHIVYMLYYILCVADGQLAVGEREAA